MIPFILLAVLLLSPMQAVEDNSTLDLLNRLEDLNLPRHNEDLVIKNPNNSGRKDGVHPTALGYKLIAEYVFRSLLENSLLEKEMMIICFGDSITYGGGANNYPSFLAELIADYLQKKLRS